jgi:Tol biopolymer transport system component
MDEPQMTSRRVYTLKDTLRLLLWVILVLALFAALAVWVWLQISRAPEVGQNPATSFQPNIGLNENSLDSTPTGRLFASGIHTSSTDPTQQSSVIFSLDLDNGEPISVLTNPFLFEPSHIRFFDRNQLNLSLLKTVTPASLAESEVPAMYLQTIDTLREEVLTVHAEARGPSITSPEVSPDQQHLAFIRLIDESLNGTAAAFEVSNWEVVVTDFETGEVVTTIAGAAQPRWSANGEYLLFLTEDSVSIYHLMSGLVTEALTLQPLTDTQATANIQTGLDVSSDGRRLVLTEPYRNQITVFEIRSWQDGTVEFLGRITTPDNQYYTPIFSPDGDFYAVYAVSRQDGVALGFDPRIEIRPTLGRQVTYEYLLHDNIEPEQFMLDEWILVPEGF